MSQRLPFTHEMAVHKMFRRGFTQGPDWIRRVPEGHTQQEWGRLAENVLQRAPPRRTSSRGRSWSWRTPTHRSAN